VKHIEPQQPLLFDDLEEPEKVYKSPFCASRMGDIAEFYAVTWLWDQGYEVFINPGSTGPIDMVAYKDEECILIDVKTMVRDHRKPDAWRNSGGCRSEYQKQLGVVLLVLYADTRQLRWINHNET